MIKEEQKLSEKILDYFRKNPGAGDTPEGIKTWWLEPGESEPPVENITAAMEILVKKGLVRKRQLHGGDVLYKKGSMSVCQ
ncbi:MAG: hypothetical protein GTO45_00015 [Candidatus Aminicenantes bacterium]|nr:hypothetical protein [Candidatus Aminicenantes bacterium]NIM77151.1 hypothetical protein [Candidatus Aminicenantes bacterium]NIN16444.1 hypothetical protein [Candidatus Aminicenantes bacterium]NIN40305.1 hypothetical protein [Candidatus Aminicenantes bacterium]NIN83124.1 hypothetical protein [Candidatus Aminicenantes bacterium]